MKQDAAAAVVIPIRSFTSGKSRLGGHLDAATRSALLQRMAEKVVDAAGTLPVLVISSAPEVVTWAESRGLALVDDPGSLDLAAQAGQVWAATRGIPRIVIAHADLPLARALPRLALDRRRPVVVIVPCHRDDGTPVLSVPVDVPFSFSYGPGSFRRHAAEARRHRLGCRVVRDPNLARDVDTPEDLAGLDFSAPVLV